MHRLETKSIAFTFSMPAQSFVFAVHLYMLIQAYISCLHYQKRWKKHGIKYLETLIYSPRGLEIMRDPLNIMEIRPSIMYRKTIPQICECHTKPGLLGHDTSLQSSQPGFPLIPISSEVTSWSLFPITTFFAFRPPTLRRKKEERKYTPACNRFSKYIIRFCVTLYSNGNLENNICLFFFFSAYHRISLNVLFLAQFLSCVWYRRESLNF